MPRVTRHACIRYLVRRPGMLGQRLSLPRLERLAAESVARSRFVSRAEAVQRVGPIKDRPWNRYYRIDETGRGVWVSCWYRGEEVVVTYLRARFHPLRVRRTLGGVVITRVRRRLPQRLTAAAGPVRLLRRREAAVSGA